MKRYFGLLSAVSLCSSVAMAASSDRPNFIVILVDDLGYNDIGCFGTDLIRTPNIDQMAQEGVRLTNFYSQPISGPARTALLTGSYPVRVAEVGNIKRKHPYVDPQEVIIPEVLREQGYTSGCIGKWDINGHKPSFDGDEYMPTEMGFDYWFGVPSIITGQPYRNKEKLPKIDVNTATQVYTHEAVSFIKREQDSPFFLYIAHNMPHTPLGASPDFMGRSAYGLFGDAVEELDWSVGEILNTLRELGLDENTYVIFTSDNGPWSARDLHCGSSYPLRGAKDSNWEGGVRVPAIFWGGKASGVDCHQVIKIMDIMPTFAAISGATLPDVILDGNDVSSLFDKGKVEGLDETYFYYMDTHLQAVRKGDWKLVLPRPCAPEWIASSRQATYRREDVDAVKSYELYNLRLDVTERRDVIEENPEVYQELLELVERVRDDLGDYYQIGKGARFYDKQEPRPEAKVWRAKLDGGWTPEIIVHRAYDQGARYNVK
ncbi:MAG: sulfatase-like hydrolase/transferase [Rikenellaceae bacterium]